MFFKDAPFSQEIGVYFNNASAEHNLTTQYDPWSQVVFATLQRQSTSKLATSMMQDISSNTKIDVAQNSEDIPKNLN